MAYTLPINNNVVRPSTSKGYENGKLPSSVLVQVPQVVTKCLMEPTAARAFSACFDLAKKMLGVTIKDVGDYRSYQEQLNLFVDRYIPVSHTTYLATSASHRKIWVDAKSYGYNSIYWIKNYAKFGYWPATAATPGTSNHGVGLALDVAQEYDNDTSPDPITEVFVAWLCTHAPKFGIYASLRSEIWHWQYVMGDAIPQAVLDYEGDTGDIGADMDLISRQQRLFDSRPITAYTGNRMAPNQVLTLTVPNHGTAKAAIINLTATQTQGPGHMSKKVDTSCLNWSLPDTNICNEVTVFLNAQGEFSIINGPSPTHVVVDLVGLWIPTV